MKGEVFVAENGQIAIAIPPAGTALKPCHQFEVGSTSTADDKGAPAWTDVICSNRPVRINPDIVQFPFHRFADCLMFAMERELPMMPLWAKSTFEGEEFGFSRHLKGKVEIVFIDRWERAKAMSEKAK